MLAQSGLKTFNLLLFYNTMSKDTFLGKVYTTLKAEKTCNWCGCIIIKGKRIRHDVWKESGKMTNKYYCTDCDFMIDHIEDNIEWPFNPETNEFITKYPWLFNKHFKNKYPIWKRINVISDLQQVFFFGRSAKFAYYIARLFRWKDFGWYNFRFDRDDYLCYKQNFKHMENNTHYLFTNWD